MIGPMKRLMILGVLSTALVGCGPKNEGQGVKTPDEILAEQEQLAIEQQKKGRDPSDYAEPTGMTDEEEKRAWDAKYAELELKRASRSAETCPESVTEKAPKGMAAVSITFKNEGNVREATIGSPYTDTMVGTCVLRAMKAVIVRTYEGPEKTIEWQVDLTGKGKSGAVGGGLPGEGSSSQ